MKGAWFEIAPKRLSQVACGFAHSAADHWFLTLAVKLSCFGPCGSSEAGKESFTENPLVDWGQSSSEEGVSAKACVLAEPEPSSPGSVTLLVACFLSAIKDDAAICNTEEAHDKISSGNWEIAKFAGICSG